MKLLKAQENDLKQILELHTKLFDYNYTYDNYLFEIDNAISHFMVLKNNEQIIGYFVIHIIYEQLEIVIIAISEEYQNQGYGQFLLDYIDYLKIKNCCHEILIEVLETNYKAISFYEKNNFFLLDRRNDYYGKGKNALIYRK